MNSTNLARINHPLSGIEPVARRFGWLILTVCLLVAYLLANFVSSGIDSINLYLYILQPVLWLGITLVAFLLWSAEGEQVKLFEHSNLVLSAAIIGGVQVAVSILFGFLAGFGNSPYTHTFLMILLNLWFVATKLVGVETARWYLGKSLGRINIGLGYLVAWLIPFILLIPIGKFGLLNQPESAFRLIGSTLIPGASENLLAAYLVLSAGPLASIAYLGVIQAFEWLSPILPDLPWLALAFVGAVVPLLGLIALNREDISSTTKDGEATNQKDIHERSLPGSLLLLAALAVGVIWLNSGALGVRPSLISGNSMNPVLYPGDVVITQNISPESIRVGDVIRFHRNGIDIIHRVKEVQNNNPSPIFITRGDNNNVEDEPVMADQLEGKLVLTIPKIGWIGILFRRALALAGGAH
jgi:signal peptidase